MSESAEERIAGLRSAAEEEQWDTFGELVDAWANEDPGNPWLAVGRLVADSARGAELSPESKSQLASLDRRLHNHLELLDALRNRDPEVARDRVRNEIAWGGREQVWLDAFAWADPGLRGRTRYLVGTPHLVAGCLTDDGQITSMAVKGSRMSADTLGHRANQIWDDVAKMNERMDIGTIQSVHVMGDDGGWVLASDGETGARFATVLVATSASSAEALARARAIIMQPEAADG